MAFVLLVDAAGALGAVLAGAAAGVADAAAAELAGATDLFVEAEAELAGAVLAAGAGAALADVASALADFFDRLFFVVVALAVPEAPEALEVLPPAVAAVPDAEASAVASVAFFDFFLEVDAVADLLLSVAVEPAELSAESVLFFLDLDFVVVLPVVESVPLCEESSVAAFFLVFFFVVVELSLL